MDEPFSQALAAGGKSNSLGKTNEVIASVLKDRKLLDKLYACILNDDAWVRMRAIDAFEKVCRVHPDWTEPYIDRFLNELAGSTQPSIQWHLAQMYTQVPLSIAQTTAVIGWLKSIVSTSEIDWIVAANTMDALMYFYRNDYITETELSKLIHIQLDHKSKSVARKANKHLQTLQEITAKHSA